MKAIILSLCVFVGGMSAVAQNENSSETEVDEFDEFEEVEDDIETIEIFSGTRVINGHSVEMLEKGELEFRVEHRFGDIGYDDNGSFKLNGETLLGFDNVADMRLAFEYGITDNMMVGIGRCKGTGAPYRALLDGYYKYKIFSQEDGGFPFSMGVLTSMSFTYMKSSEDMSEVSSFPNWQHRFAYATQLNVAKKIGDRLSLSLSPTVVHRNFVSYDDVNTLFAIGGAVRFSVTQRVALIAEYFKAFSDSSVRTNNTNSLGFAVEWFTFGHNFTINITNSKGFGETQFIPYTYEKWGLGQFRLGFSISRKFVMQ